MEMIKLCPILKKMTIIHNTIHDARVPHIGINTFRDNDIVIQEFLPCIEEECMMFDITSRKCRYKTDIFK